VIRQAFSRTKSYILRAGPAIFLFALIVWVGTTFPRYDLQDRTARLNASYASQVGREIQPVFRPMGGDWRTGVGLISAFAAREVFVSSLAVLFQATGSQEENSLQESLLGKMHDAKAPDGLPLFTLASVIGLILFFMIALQCLSTVTVAFKESGGWRFAIAQLVIFNVVAYALSVSVVQGLRALGVS
jgi:ferrous iron transport protein B